MNCQRKDCMMAEQAAERRASSRRAGDARGDRVTAVAAATTVVAVGRDGGG
jgi:hypothetical protein